jgi:hypothetical protein
VVEWDQPAELQTQAGTLKLNQQDDSGYWFILDHEKCSAGPTPLRVVTDNIPQADGDILHRTFKPGFQIKLAVQLWADAEHPAGVGGVTGSGGAEGCGPERRLMWELLTLHANRLLNEDGRYVWSPIDYTDDRMLDGLRLLEWPVPVDEGTLTVVTFAVHSRFPYLIDATETDTSITDGNTVSVVNAGTVDFFPVFKVYGPCSDFTITNNTTGLSLFYDSDLPGASGIAAGHYVEIDFFRDTLYLDGDQANMKPGLDVVFSDFFPLVPGGNDISISGADCTCLSNNCFAG